MDWTVEIKRRIDERMEHYQIEDQDPTYSFIGERRLREAWGYLYQAPEYYHVPTEVFSLRQHILDESDPEQSVVKIASILIRIKWSAWKEFTQIFIEANATRRDGNLPFKLRDLSREDFLGSEHAQLFFDVQSTFLPITIEQGNDCEYSTHFRLPFNLESEKPSTGSFGAVTKVKVARGYLKYQNGEYNHEQELTLARKCVRRLDAYDREVRNLRIIRVNAQKHDNIMGHIGTIVVGAVFNIFFDWAERDLHDLLYNSSDMHESHRPPHRLLYEAGELADAVNFLHKHIKVNSAPQKCYHMDLKPENIVIRERSPDDPIGMWMITDFGISIFHDNFTGSRTTAQRYGGAFQPPEIDESWGKRTEGINEKGDIWGLGCILCMVLAFAIGGTDSVEALKHARAYNAVGKQRQDFFYVLIPNGSEREMTLKRSVQKWLKEIAENDHEAIWVSECVKLIFWILKIDQRDRPTAEQIHEKLGVISRLSKPGGQLSRQSTYLPEIPHEYDHPPVRHDMGRHQSLTLTPSPTAREPGFGPLNSTFGRIFNSRKSSAQQSEKHITEINHKRMSTSTQGSDYILQQPFKSVSPSSGSTGGIQLDEGIRLTLKEVTERKTKDLPKDIALCPTGLRMIVCMEQETIIYERLQNHDRPAYMSFKFLNPCHCAFVAGPFYALQSVIGANLILDSVDTESDSPFGSTNSTESRVVLDIDISTKGIVALRLPTSVQLRVAKTTMRQNELEQQSELKQQPYTYNPTGKHRDEKFLALKFTADGERLMACSWKHWFLWDLRTFNQTSLDEPKIGDLDLTRPQSTYKPTIIPMTIRAAFLVYDSASETIWLYDSTLDHVAKDHHGKMMCGIVTPQDTHLLYIRAKRVRTKHHYALMRKSIDLAGSGQSRHLILGEEKWACDLSGLQYKAGAILRLAFLQPGSSCDLIVASSTGEVIEVHLTDS